MASPSCLINTRYFKNKILEIIFYLFCHSPHYCWYCLEQYSDSNFSPNAYSQRCHAADKLPIRTKSGRNTLVEILRSITWGKWDIFVWKNSVASFSQYTIKSLIWVKNDIPFNFVIVHLYLEWLQVIAKNKR